MPDVNVPYTKVQSAARPAGGTQRTEGDLTKLKQLVDNLVTSGRRCRDQRGHGTATSAGSQAERRKAWRHALRLAISSRMEAAAHGPAGAGRRHR